MCSSIWSLVILYLLVFMVVRRQPTQAAFDPGSYDGVQGGNLRGFRSSLL